MRFSVTFFFTLVIKCGLCSFWSTLYEDLCHDVYVFCKDVNSFWVQCPADKAVLVMYHHLYRPPIGAFIYKTDNTEFILINIEIKIFFLFRCHYVIYILTLQ